VFFAQLFREKKNHVKNNRAYQTFLYISLVKLKNNTIMESTKEMKECIKREEEAQMDAKSYVEEILSEKGEFEFDWEDSDAPSLVSTTFDDDITDAYITRLWAEKTDEENIVIYANLHACYIGDEAERVSLGHDECNVDWCDILWWLLEMIERENISLKNSPTY